MKYDACPCREYRLKEKEIFALMNNESIIRKMQAYHISSNEPKKSVQIREILSNMYSLLESPSMAQKMDRVSETVALIPKDFLDNQLTRDDAKTITDDAINELTMIQKNLCDYCRLMLENYNELNGLVKK